MTDMTTHPPATADRGARAAVAAPLLAVFSIGAGAPLYAQDLSEAGATGRFALAAGTSLAVLLALVVGLLALHLRQRHAVGDGVLLAALLGTVLATGSAWEQLFSVPFVA